MNAVCILWHLHQPCYRDPLLGEFLLPWVRLHAARSYADMAERLLEAEGARATLNLTPVLMDQLDAYRAGAGDRWERLALSDAESLDAEGRLLALSLLFNVEERRFEEFPAYAALRERLRGLGPLPQAVSRVGASDLRDLQAWFHLAWCGPILGDDPLVRGLRERGRGFREADKQALGRLMADRLAAVPGAFLKAQEAGSAELSTSPYAHPILPLLCDAADVDPAPGAKPPLMYRHPGDAGEQVRRACAAHAGRWGQVPAGLWPSEGAVSQEALGAAAPFGLRWIASDQAVLRKSLMQEGRTPTLDDTLTPHRVSVDGKEIAVFFRDTELSDLIGFEYARWEPDRAAEDLEGRIEGRLRHGGGNACVTLALDGENPWGAYADGGRPFLKALYRRLGKHSALRMRTFSEHLDALGGVSELPALRGLAAGSWIYGDLGTWAAHPEQREAWGLLAEVRAHWPEGAPLPDELLLAEGSDWFWWMGDRHPTAQKPVFVHLFTSFLRKACRSAGAPDPAGLQAWERRALSNMPCVGEGAMARGQG